MTSSPRGTTPGGTGPAGLNRRSALCAGTRVRPCGPAGLPASDSPLVRWLHERRAAGDVMVLHGFDHSLDPVGAGPLQSGGRRAEFAARCPGTRPGFA